MKNGMLSPLKGVCYDCGKEVEKSREGKTRCGHCARLISIRNCRNNIANGHLITHWIPSTYEVYPTSDKGVLVTDRSGDVYILEKLEGQTWAKVMRDSSVTAWRDLPVAYKKNK